VYFEVYPHVYELYKLKSSQDRNAMLKEMMELVGPPERVILPLPNLAATGRKPHPCLLITAEGLLQVALKMKNSTPDIVAVLNQLYSVCSQQSVEDLIYQAEVLHPELVVMGQTWQRAWSTGEVPQISTKLDSLPSSNEGSSSAHTPTSSVSSPPAGSRPDKISTATKMQYAAFQSQGQQSKSSKTKTDRRSRESSVDDGDEGDTEDNTEHGRTIGRVPVTNEMKSGSQPLFVPSQRRRIEEGGVNEQPMQMSNGGGCLMPPMVSNVHQVLASMPPMQQQQQPQMRQFQPLNDPNLVTRPGNNWHR